MHGELTRIAKNLDLKSQNNLFYLQHLVLASHGKQEFGSPVLPKMIEAEILSALDILDAKLYIINKALQKTTFNRSTTSIFALENRNIFRHYQNHIVEATKDDVNAKEE